MRRSLEQVQGGQGAEARRGEGGEVERLRAENRALRKENRTVQADNHRLTVELCRLQEENSRLTRVSHMTLCTMSHMISHDTCNMERTRLEYFSIIMSLMFLQEGKETRERLFALESEREHIQPELARARTLQEKVAALERELLVLDRLYQRQREEALALLARGGSKQEWTTLTGTLREEKEGMYAQCTQARVYTLSTFFLIVF